MKKVVTPIIRYLIDKAKRNKYIQNIFESPFELDKFPITGEFRDAAGNLFQLREGLRTKIKPGWQRMLAPVKPELSGEYLSQLKQNGSISVNKITPVIGSQQKSISGLKVLEIGCNTGAASFTMAQMGAEVTGSEFSGYKVESVKEENIRTLASVNQDLQDTRSKLSQLYNPDISVKFVDDDICHSSLESESFDLICSWEVLEHLHDPEQAIRSMYSLLKPGGIMVHEYNPFFCINGGHSLCTLDFLWGHVRLSEDDFSKYLDSCRPDEKERAWSYFKNGLNRMTMHDLRTYLEQVGFMIESIIPYSKEQHVRMVDDKILSQSKANYQNLTLIDLCAPRVLVVVAKV